MLTTKKTTTDQETLSSSQTEQIIKDSTTIAETPSTSKTTRNPKVIVSGSSYDRGLEHLLKIWPDVVKVVPDAKLRVFYGWTLFDKVYKGNPERMEWKAKIEEMMKVKGVTHLGRISHGALKVEMEKAGIWAYPTHFGEISCITGMRAQALGTVPVVINYAALRETVKYGVKIEGDIYDPEILEEYKNALIDMLQHPEKQEEIRKEMMPWAREKFAWANVAKQWDAEFKKPARLETLVEKEMDNNQALRAWDLVKDTDSPLKERVWLKVRHAFRPKYYRKFYEEQLVEVPMEKGQVFPSRFEWIDGRLRAKMPRTLADLGCATGEFCLTIAKAGIKATGVNLYKPSVDRANKIAKKRGLDAVFIQGDVMDHGGKYDAVVAMEILEHVLDPQALIDHAYGLLNDGGSLYISTPSTKHIGIERNMEGKKHWGQWDDGLPAGHLRMFTKKDILELVKGYKSVDVSMDAEKCFLIEIQK